MKRLSSAPLLGWPLTLPTIIGYAEKLVRDKHSGLLQTLINYGLKKFYNMVPVVNVIELFTDVIPQFLQ